MKSNYSAKLAEISAAENVRDAIFNSLPDPKSGEHEMLHSKVLVAGYVMPEKTKGGIYVAQKTLDEQRFQGTVGLVIALGPGAFVDTAVDKFYGKKIKVGDWVMYRASDGLELFINEVPCRIFDDSRILMRVIDPELYW